MTTLRGPAFSPWGRFQLLSLALEDVPAEHAAELLPLVVTAAIVVVRQVRGERSPTEAYAHVELARRALERAQRRTTPHAIENGRSA